MAGRRKLVPVSEAARRMGVSRQRVMQRINDGSVRAEKIGSQWAVDASTLRPPHTSRSLSARMAWALVGAPIPMAAVERERTAERIERLRSRPASERARLLRSWLTKRGEPLDLEVHPHDIPNVRDDDRLLLTGVSDPRFQLSSGHQLEAYIRRDQLQDFADHYFIDLQADAEMPNVWLRIVPELDPGHVTWDTYTSPKSEVRLAPLLFSVTDLLEFPLLTSRDRQAALEMLEGLWQ